MLDKFTKYIINGAYDTSSIQDYDYPADNINCYLADNDYYSPFDDRVLKSYVEDIEGGDNFIDYVSYFFDTYGKDIFDY